IAAGPAGAGAAVAAGPPSRLLSTLPQPPSASVAPASSHPPLPIDFIRQQPHRQCVKIGTIVIEYRTIVAGEQISGFPGTVGFEQGRLDMIAGPAPADGRDAVGAPLGHR